MYKQRSIFLSQFSHLKTLTYTRANTAVVMFTYYHCNLGNTSTNSHANKAIDSFRYLGIKTFVIMHDLVLQYFDMQTNLINLWFPSMCHNERGPGTQYLRLYIEFLHLCWTPACRICSNKEYRSLFHCIFLFLGFSIFPSVI